MNWRKLLGNEFCLKSSTAFLINTYFMKSPNCSDTNSNIQQLTIEIDSNIQQSPESVKYAIIGLGAAGQSAKNEILKLDSRKSMVLIDPFLNHLKNIDKINNIIYENKEISGIDVVSRLIYFKDNSFIRYDKCLISSGAIPSKVNQRYFDQGIQNHIYEVQDKESHKILINLVTQGNHVTILGSNWNAIELCNILIKHATKAGFKNNVTLVMPSFGPMSLTFPRYLSNAISKRLISNNVELITNSQVRYISNPNTLPHEITSKTSPNLAVYISKTFDMLSTSAFTTDAIILCSDSSPTHYKSITDLTDTYLHAISGIEFDLKNHKILANSFLMASSDLYVAGDLCSVPSPLGRAVYIGEDHAIESGKIAARNMTGIRQLYNYLPAYESHADEMGLHFISIGNCSAALETYGYWWKALPVLPSTSNSTSVTSIDNNLNQTQKQLLTSNKDTNNNTSKTTSTTTLIDNLKTSLLNTTIIPSSPKKQITTIKDDTPFGKLKVSTKNIQPTTTTITTTSTIPPLSPLGIGIVFYINKDVIEGILLSGISPASSPFYTATTATTLDNNNNSSSSINIRDKVYSDMDRIKESVRENIGKKLSYNYQLNNKIVENDTKNKKVHSSPYNNNSNHNMKSTSRLDKAALLNALAVHILSQSNTSSQLSETVNTTSPMYRYCPKSLSATMLKNKNGGEVIRNTSTIEQLFAMGDTSNTSELE